MPSASELARLDAESEEETAIADTVIDGLQTRAQRLGFPSIGEALDHIENSRPREGEIRITVEDASGLCVLYVIDEMLLDISRAPHQMLETHAGIATDRFLKAREAKR